MFYEYIFFISVVLLTLFIQQRFMTTKIINNKNEQKNVKLNSNLRRLQHCFTGLFFVLLTFTPIGSKYIDETKIILSLCTISFYLGNFIRLRYKPLNDLFIKQYSTILRKEEAEGKKIPASFYFLLGSTITYIFFTKNIHIVRLSFLYLSLADPIASFIGKRYGLNNKIIFNKSIMGCLASLITGFIITYIYTNDINSSLIGALICSFSEFFVPLNINDNLSIPILSAFLLKQYENNIKFPNNTLIYFEEYTN